MDIRMYKNIINNQYSCSLCISMRIVKYLVVISLGRITRVMYLDWEKINHHCAFNRDRIWVLYVRREHPKMCVFVCVMWWRCLLVAWDAFGLRVLVLLTLMHSPALSFVFVFVCVWLVFYVAFNNFSVISGLAACCTRNDSSWVLSAINTNAPCRSHKTRVHHPVTLSWHRANQSWFYPLYAERLVRTFERYKLIIITHVYVTQ